MFEWQIALLPEGKLGQTVDLDSPRRGVGAPANLAISQTDSYLKRFRDCTKQALNADSTDRCHWRVGGSVDLLTRLVHLNGMPNNGMPNGMQRPALRTAADAGR